MAAKFIARTVSFPARWSYSPSDFTRMDESLDTQFYASPRFVNHIDDNAILSLKRYYKASIPANSRVLDVASSWVSHLPEHHGLHVTGVGLNMPELEGNKQLNARHVKDLNIEPSFAGMLPDESVDAVICNVSIDYLTRPRAVCCEMARVLKPGGKVHLAISNRCFPTKVVSRWLRISEEERLQMVAEYLHFAQSEDASQVLFKDIEIVEVVKPFWGSDPLNVVRGTRI